MNRNLEITLVYDLVLELRFRVKWGIDRETARGGNVLKGITWDQYTTLTVLTILVYGIAVVLTLNCS